MKNQAKIRNAVKDLGYSKRRSTRDFLSVRSKSIESNIVIHNFSRSFDPFVMVTASMHAGPNLPEVFRVAKAIAAKTGGTIKKQSRTFIVQL